MLAVVLACIGYLEKRIFSETPIMAGTTWILALLVLCIVLSRLPESGFLGIVFVIISVGAGIAGIVRYLSGKRNPG